jgi:hypothetical protein
MGDYEPSNNFTTRIMAEIRVYEDALSHAGKHNYRLQLSKPALTVLTAGGVLLGIVNLIRFASILISPALCL